MNYFESDIFNSTNRVVYFDEKGGNLHLRLRRSPTVCATHVGEFYLSKMSALSLNNLTLLRKEHIARVHNLQQLATDKAL
jgi:hypothetical protein